MNPYQSYPAIIDSITKQARQTKLFRVGFEAKRKARLVRYYPGQFMQVGLPGLGEVPISMSSSPTRPGYLEFCIRAVGKVTNAIHCLRTGAKMWLRGPYGRGFPEKGIKGRDLYFIAGGIGLAPLRSLINMAFDRRKDFGRISVFYGAREAEELCFLPELEHWGNLPNTSIQTTIDNPQVKWKGNVGLVTELWPKPGPARPSQAFAFICGPPVMIKAVVSRLLASGLRKERIFMLLERHMKCGIGKCGHCNIGEKFVCMDGPVFSCAELSIQKKKGYA